MELFNYLILLLVQDTTTEGKNTISPAKCLQGYYCTNWVSEGTKRLAGYYRADMGLSAATDCTICPQGRYCT